MWNDYSKIDRALQDMEFNLKPMIVAVESNIKELRYDLQNLGKDSVKISKKEFIENPSDLANRITRLKNVFGDKFIGEV